ncbi:MAG: putative T7SS-secreted protein, partial [Pseudonocardiaceae bacterium]
MSLDGHIDKIAPLRTGNYPSLGFDPAPGSVAGVTEVANNLGSVARELGEAYSDLTQIGRSGGIWEGEAAEAFQGKVGELPDYLDKAHRSLSGACTTLGDWAADLTTMQQQARDYERLAAQALAQVETAEANPNLGLRGQIFTDPAELRRAEDALANAERALSNATDSLTEIRENAQRLLDQHHDLAGRIAEALRKAKDEAPEEPGLLDELGDAFGDLVDGITDLASDVWGWIEENADLIAQIGDVLSTIGNVLGVVALATSWIPGVNAVTAAAAIGVSAAAAGTKLLAKAAGADVSWGSIGMDALGVIPGGKVVAGAKNAATQTIKTAGAAKVAA